MDKNRMVKVSKYLSKHLRHQPERLGLRLETGGWVAVDDLLAACINQNFPVSREELYEVVESNDKQRFSFDEKRERIRANQGHSIEVDLQLEPGEPPKVLYHGTGASCVEAITSVGLRRMARHHVHLSVDIVTATRVGARHGRPVVFEVNAAAMHQDGYEFLMSANGVWLVESVPPKYLRRLE